MAALSAEQVAQIAAQAGFSGRELVYMVAIAKRESGYNPAAHRSDTDKSKLLGDRGLFQINSANDQTLMKAGIIKNRSDLLDPVTNAKAAFYLSGGGKNLQPWGMSPGKGWSAGGNPLAGTNVTAAQAAVERAQTQGLLGQAYQGTSAGAGASAYNYTPYQAPTRGPQMNAQEERAAFDTYLKGKTPDEQKSVIDSLKQPRTLAEVGAFMNTAPEEVKRYVNFMSTLDATGQYQEKNLLAAPDPAGSKQMTDLLNTFGVSYPNAPNPTPALLAFLNGIGLNLSTAEDVKRRALERIGASTSDAMADLDRTAGRAKQNVTADLIRRNVVSSGESNTRYARQAEDVASKQSDIQRNKANASDQVETSYTQSRDLARQQALDRIIGAEQSQATERATSAAQVDATRAQQSAQQDYYDQQKAANDASLKAQTEAMKASAGASV